MIYYNASTIKFCNITNGNLTRYLDPVTLLSCLLLFLIALIITMCLLRHSIALH